MNKLLLIDGNSLVYRAFYGSYNPYRNTILQNSKGEPVNAVLTFEKILSKILRNEKPDYLLVAFDKGKKTIRHDKLPSYKSGRKKTPPELIFQFPLVKEMLSKMGIKFFELENIEADDIIATIAERYKDELSISIVSSDRDLLQLVTKNVQMIIPQNGQKENLIFNNDNFVQTFEYRANQVPDIKGLVGDPSDNLPGVKGVGIKSATKLLLQYDTLENIYLNLDEIKGTIREKLEKDKDISLLCKELAILIKDVQIPFGLDEILIKETPNEDLINFFQKFELNSLVKKHLKKDD